MNALFVSNDPSIFDAASATRERMRAYAAAIGTLHIVPRASAEAHEETDGALVLHPVRAGKILAPFALRRVARALIRTQGIEVVSAQDPFEQGWAAMQAVKGTAAK